MEVQPKEPDIGWGPDALGIWGNFEGKGWPVVKYRDTLW